MIKTYAIVAGTALIALMAGLWVSSYRAGLDAASACRAVRVAGGLDSIGGPFELIDHTGRAVTDADVITGPTILYFGYTFCPDVCPADTARNAEAVVLLEEEGYMVTPVMISIDPGRDTPEVMSDFIFNLHERMIGLTGTEEQVRAASAAYRGFYQRSDDDPEYYLISHSTMSYYVTPEEGVVDVFNRDTTPREIANSITCFINTPSEIDPDAPDA